MPEIKQSILLVLDVHSFLKFNRTFWFSLPFSIYFALAKLVTQLEERQLDVQSTGTPGGAPPPGIGSGIVRLRFQPSLWYIRDLTHKQWRRQGRRLAKNVFLFYFGISDLLRSIQCVCSVSDRNTKSWPLWFTFSKQRRTCSFHVAVLPRTTKKCTSIITQPLPGVQLVRAPRRKQRQKKFKEKASSRRAF